MDNFILTECLKRRLDRFRTQDLAGAHQCQKKIPHIPIIIIKMIYSF